MKAYSLVVLFLLASVPVPVAMADVNVSPISHFNPIESGRFLKLPQVLKFGRSGHNVQVLDDGRVLVAGGAWGDLGGENSAEILQLKQGRLRTSSVRMNTLRSASTQSQLPDGRILLIGGAADFEPALLSTEFFDSNTNLFAKGPDLKKERSGHASVTLPDGRVLVFGGTDGNAIHDTVEIYDPSQQAFQLADVKMSVPRANHTATLVNNSTIALIGGETEVSESDSQAGPGFLNSVELFDIPSMKFVSLNSKMRTPRIYHTANRIDDERVLITGGLSDVAQSTHSIEILNLKDRSVVEIGFALRGRSLHTLTQLKDGSFLMAGGVENGVPLSDSEVCRLISSLDINCLAGAKMSRARWMHTTTFLPDGRILFVGGLTNTPEARGKAAGPIRGLEVFQP